MYFYVTGKSLRLSEDSIRRINQILEKLPFTHGPVMKSENVIGKHEKKTSQLRKETEGSATGEKTSRTVL